MFTELGRVIEECRAELDNKVVNGGGDARQVAVLAHRIQQWFSRIEGQTKRCERHVFEALGKRGCQDNTGGITKMYTTKEEVAAERAGNLAENVFSWTDEELKSIIKFQKLCVAFLSGRGPKWHIAKAPLLRELDEFRGFLEARQ